MVILDTFFPERNQQHRNDLMYLEGEPTGKQKSVIIGSNLDSLQSKTLLTGIILRLKANKTLLGIQSEKARIILIGIKIAIRESGESLYLIKKKPCKQSG